MRLLVGVHLNSEYLENKDFNNFVKKNFEADPNTFFFVFDWVSFSQKEMLEISKKFGAHKERFLLIRTKKEISKLAKEPPVSKALSLPCSKEPTFSTPNWSGKFTPYKESFENALRTVSRSLGPKEKVLSVFFGGSAPGCFNKISHSAAKTLKNTFPKRLSGIHSNLRWAYDIKGSKQPTPKNKKLKIKQKPTPFSFLRIRRKA